MTNRGKKAQSFQPIYMIIVILIAIVLLLTFVKPLFQQASSVSSSGIDSARQVIKFIPMAFS